MSQTITHETVYLKRSVRRRPAAAEAPGAANRPLEASALSARPLEASALSARPLEASALSVLPLEPRPHTIAYRLESLRLPALEEALPFGEMARRAAIRVRSLGGHSRPITGKEVDGTRLQDHGHAHYLALDLDGDGLLDCLLVHAPDGFAPPDLEALRSLSLIHATRDRPAVSLLPIDGRLAETLPVLGLSRYWRSVTPFSLPRFASRGKGLKARPRDLPDAQLRRELRLRGLPEPVAIEALEGATLKDGRTLTWDYYNVERFNGARGFGVTGFELTFDRPVRGPLALGFGCHFGLGLFLPTGE